MSDLLLLGFVLARNSLRRTARRVGIDERGEGVISAAIAVLILAFIGALLWVAFKDIFDSTTDKTKDQVDQIGR